MNKVIVIVVCFLISLNSSGQVLKSDLHNSKDESSIDPSLYYVTKIEQENNELKEQLKTLHQENANLCESLSYYINNESKLKLENSILAFALFLFVLLLLSLIAWYQKKKILYLYKSMIKNIQEINIHNHKSKGNYFKKNIQPNKLTMQNIEDKNDLESLHQNNTPPIVSRNKIVTKGKWFVVGRSVIGKSHIESNIPCQDFNHLEKINDIWGIAVSCDGAGSATNSHIGSEFLAKESAIIFKNIFLKEHLDKNGELPEDSVWQEKAKAGLYQAKQSLDDFALSKGYKIDSLACTIILAIYSPLGILVTHIGDGRAGFLSQNNEWKPMWFSPLVFGQNYKRVIK